jgi:hypothetical protein
LPLPPRRWGHHDGRAAQAPASSCPIAVAAA